MMRGIQGTVILAAALLAGPSGGGPSPASASELGPRIRAIAAWPRTGDTAVLTDQVVVRFSRPLATSTADASTFRFTTTSGTPVPGSFTPGETRKGDTDARILVFTPDLPLEAGIGYRAHLTTGLTSDRGRPIDEPILVNFATSSAKIDDGSIPLVPGEKPRRLPSRGPAPRVTYSEPLGGQGNVFSEQVRVRFSLPVAQDSVNGASFQVLQGSKPVPGTIVPDPESGGREVLFVPENLFFPDTSYQIVVTRGVRSDRDRFLREEFRAGFSTSPFMNSIVPVREEDFHAGPDLEVGRAFHTASPLGNGDVLVVGGETLTGEPLAATELFHRGEDSFETMPSLATARRKHAAVVLKDGRVLVCGGFGLGGSTLATTEIFRPIDGTWVPGPSMSVSRTSHTATLLPNGRVLVAAGYTTDPGSLTWTVTAEIYDPIANSWSPTAGAPQLPRGGHTATTMEDGRILIAGGGAGNDKSAEIFVPATGTFVLPQGQPLEHRIFHAAALTRQGTVLLAGGGPPQAEQYDPVSDSFVPAGSNPVYGLSTTDSPLFLTLTPIAGKRIVQIGGFAPDGAGAGLGLVLDQVQVWAATGLSATGAFYRMFFDLAVPRAAHTVTPLGDGRFLVVGGFGTSGTTNEKRTTIFLPTQ